MKTIGYILLALVALMFCLIPFTVKGAMTSAQQADALFKASLGVGNSAPAKQFYEQPTPATPVVIPSQVWQQADSIPATAPGGTDQQTTGVVKRWIDLTLTLVSGSTQAYTHAALADAIPFNYGDGTSYNYAIKDSTNAAIPFGTNDWVLQNGVLTFYAGAPANMPPKISFYQYVGTKGVGSGTGSAITAIHGGTF
jgi:hypothetical protein